MAITEQTVIKGHWGSRQVTIDNQPLAEFKSQNIRNHSPDGFCWGYGGSGPAQLALALMLEATGDAQMAQQLYQSFKAEVIAALPQADFVLSGKQISDWLMKQNGLVRASVES